MEKSLNRVIYIIIILALIAINVGVYIHFNKKETSSNKGDLTENNIVENIMNEEKDDDDETVNEIVDKKIASMDEASRAKIYCGKFMDAIEKRDYERAYSYLNVTFKSNYFPSLNEFSEYMEKKYPKNGIALKYDSIERKGEVFILDVTVFDDSDSEFEKFTQTIVVRENSLNNFSISFSKDNERSGGVE